MKTSLVILFAMLLFTGINAQDESSKKAKDILDKVSAKMKSYTTIKADFLSTLENLQDDVKENLKGSILLKGNKYKVEMMGTIVFFDGKTQWTYLKDANEVNISEPDPNDESALNPATIFKIWEKDFKYKFVKESFEKSKALYEIDLFPKNLDKSYSRITLKIDKDKSMIHSLKYVGKEGNHYTIEIITLVPNVEANDNTFIFNEKAYPKVEKVDMR
jgi:outer membrane lipoprotein-sorting protein